MVGEKRNQNYLELESLENEELEIMKGIREIICFLPDEKIYLGDMGGGSGKKKTVRRNKR